ncbi:unnamed protein product, partial [Prorocentrum cordatum]
MRQRIATQYVSHTASAQQVTNPPLAVQAFNMSNGRVWVNFSAAGCQRCISVQQRAAQNASSVELLPTLEESEVGSAAASASETDECESEPEPAAKRPRVTEPSAAADGMDVAGATAADARADAASEGEGAADGAARHGADGAAEAEEEAEAAVAAVGAVVAEQAEVEKAAAPDGAEEAADGAEEAADGAEDAADGAVAAEQAEAARAAEEEEGEEAEVEKADDGTAATCSPSPASASLAAASAASQAGAAKRPAGLTRLDEELFGGDDCVDGPGTTLGADAAVAAGEAADGAEDAADGAVVAELAKQADAAAAKRPAGLSPEELTRLDEELFGGNDCIDGAGTPLGADAVVAAGEAADGSARAAATCSSPLVTAAVIESSAPAAAVADPPAAPLRRDSRVRDAHAAADGDDSDDHCIINWDSPNTALPSGSRATSATRVSIDLSPARLIDGPRLLLNMADRIDDASEWMEQPLGVIDLVSDHPIDSAIETMGILLENGKQVVRSLGEAHRWMFHFVEAMQRQWGDA